MLDSLWPHGSHARFPCPSSTPGAYPNSCLLSWWCHSTISSSIIPFSSHLQSFPAWGSFLMSQFFASSGQSIGTSASASVLPMDIQGWIPLGWTGLLSLSYFVQSCLTLSNSMDCNTQGSPFFTNSQSLLKLKSIEPVMPSYHPIVCRPLLLLPLWGGVIIQLS